MGKAANDTTESTTKPKRRQKQNARMKITRAQAIKLFCIECMGYQKRLVKDCPDIKCPLWPYRLGRGQEYTDVNIRSEKDD